MGSVGCVCAGMACKGVCPIQVGMEQGGHGILSRGEAVSHQGCVCVCGPCRLPVLLVPLPGRIRCYVCCMSVVSLACVAPQRGCQALLTRCLLMCPQKCLCRRCAVRSVNGAVHVHGCAPVLHRLWWELDAVLVCSSCTRGTIPMSTFYVKVVLA